MIDRYINPHTDFGFMRLFGSEFNKELLISFLNAMFHGEQNVQNVKHLNSEQLGDRADARRAIFDVYCENDKGEKFIVGMYVLKNLSRLMQRPAALQERVFTRLFEQAEISKFNKLELKMYEDSVNAYRDIVNAIRTAEKKKYAEGHVDGEAEGLAKGLAKGREEGRTEGIAEVAKTMLNKEMSTEFVAEITGLSVDEIQRILNT